MNNKYKFILIIIVCIITSFLTTFLYNMFFSTPNYIVKVINSENNDEVVLADETNLSFSSDDVGYDNSESGIQSNNVRGAIDELYACASNFTTYDTRLQGVETKVGSTTLNTTSQDLSGAINEINMKSILNVENVSDLNMDYPGTMTIKFFTSVNGPSNKPSSGIHFFGFIIEYDRNNLVQIVFSDDGKIYRRWRNFGSWSSWTSLTFS